MRDAPRFLIVAFVQLLYGPRSMSLESLYGEILVHRVPIILLLLCSPWVTYLSCYMLSGRKAEPLLLNVNLYGSMFSLFVLAGYLVYATNTGGWAAVVPKADILLLRFGLAFFRTCRLKCL